MRGGVGGVASRDVPPIPIEARRQRLGVRAGHRVGQPRAFVATGHQAPALRRGGLQQVERAQAGAGAFAEEVQEGDRPGDWLSPADQPVGRTAAQPRQRVAVAEPGGRTKRRGLVLHWIQAAQRRRRLIQPSSVGSSRI